MSQRRALVLVAAVLAAPPVRAEIVLDDFTETAVTNSPGMFQEIVTTTSVGELNATRRIQISASTISLYLPVASFDVNSSVPGSMTADIADVGGRVDNSSPSFAFNFDYDVGVADLTQGGVNNAFLLDFARFAGTEPPDSIGLLLRDGQRGITFFSEILDFSSFESASGAFTAAIPFDSFTVRDGSPGLPNFTEIRTLSFDFWFFVPARDMQWSAELTAIRVGAIPVPEPPAGHAVLLAGIGAAVVVRGRRGGRTIGEDRAARSLLASPHR